MNLELAEHKYINLILLILSTPPPATPSPLSAATISSSLSSQSPVDLFKRGIKRDFSAFPTFKDEKNNDQWHRTFTNVARAQDLSDVLNPQYVPQTTAAYNLFWKTSRLSSKPQRASPSYGSKRVCMMLREHTRSLKNITSHPAPLCSPLIRL
jgi:hypothetical protein